MLFNSLEFIFAFLPITLLVYFSLTRYGYYEASKVWLLVSSLFFYGWWNPKYLILIAISMLINFTLAKLVATTDQRVVKKTLFISGLIFNLGLLGYYKYADFFIENFNYVTGTDYNLLNIILPLGISFFTFQQIAYLVDSYKNQVTEFNFVHYGVFVSFFPQLIAGPIVHHKDIMPQLLDQRLAHPNAWNIAKGIFIFQMGLAKKIIIADTFGKIANAGYANFELLDLPQSWITAFAYTVQLYFDFSGYSDMAIGLGLLFNIQIPNNFFSPHKSESIQQFYRRWHITLSSFLRDYLYIPLGGNKSSEWRTHINLFITFLLGGLWHGANWTFVIWGALNGIALIIHRLYQKTKIGMPYIMAVAITFLFVMLVRVFFRADSFSVAFEVLRTMLGLRQPDGNFVLIGSIYDAPYWIAGVILLFMPNSTQIAEKFNTNMRFALMTIALVLLNLTFMNSAVKQDFLYFDF